MLKFLVIAVVFAVPSFSRLPNFIQTKKSIIQGDLSKYRDFNEKCIKVSSAVGVDFNEIESIYEAYAECATEVGDYEQLYRDTMEVLVNVYRVRPDSTFNLSDKQKTEMVTFLQTYCPKVIKYMKCDDVLSPIYEKCFTVVELNEITTGKSFWLQLLENICENNVKHLVQAIHTVDIKGLECGLKKRILMFPQLWHFFRPIFISKPKRFLQLS